MALSARGIYLWSCVPAAPEPPRGDTGATEGGRRAGAGREDAEPQVVLDRAWSPLRVAARRAEGGDRPRARRVQAAGEGASSATGGYWEGEEKKKNRLGE